MVTLSWQAQAVIDQVMQKELVTYVHDDGGSVGARSGKNSAILDVLHSEGELVASRDFAALIESKMRP